MVWFAATPPSLICIPAIYRRRKFKFDHFRVSDSLTVRCMAIADLARELAEKKPLWRRKVHSLLNGMIVDICRHLGEIEHPMPPQRIDPVRKARLILETRFREPLQIKSLGTEVGLSPNYLSHQFRQLYGVSFKDYLQAVRLHHAQTLLQKGRSIKQTAAECGFHSVHYFTKVFKKRLDQPPGKFLRSSQ